MATTTGHGRVAHSTGVYNAGPHRTGMMLLELRRHWASRVRDARSFFRGIVRAGAYERYVAHYDATHLSTPMTERPVLMSERDFWSDQIERQTELAPDTGCCSVIALEGRRASVSI